jgi:hypothetical protein
MSAWPIRLPNQRRLEEQIGLTEYWSWPATHMSAFVGRDFEVSCRHGVHVAVMPQAVRKTRHQRIIILEATLARS